LKQAALPESDEIDEPAFEDEQEFGIPREMETDQENDGQEAQGAMDTDAIYTSAKFEPYPTPESTPPAALLAHSIQRIGPDQGPEPQPFSKTII